MLAQKEADHDGRVSTCPGPGPFRLTVVRLDGAVTRVTAVCCERFVSFSLTLGNDGTTDSLIEKPFRAESIETDASGLMRAHGVVLMPFKKIVGIIVV